MTVDAPHERPRRERVREQLRRQTIEEIEQAAFALLDDGGVDAVSVAAVGKAMGMTAPALYRYHASREALVDALVTRAYADLGHRVAAAAEKHDGTARDRVALIAREYRRWALAHPRRFTMLFTDRSPGAHDPADGVAAFNRGMLALLAALAEAVPGAPSRHDARLGDELRRWAEAIGAPPDASPEVLRLGVLLWTRVHGLVTIEISGAFATMGLDAGLLLETEVAAVLDGDGG